MKALFYLLLIVVILSGYDNANKSVLVEMAVNKFPYEIKSFSITDTSNNWTYDFVVIDKYENSERTDNARLLKIEFPSDSTFSIKSYLIENKKKRLKGNMGHFNRAIVKNVNEFQKLIIQCYLKTWGSYDNSGR